MPNDVVENIESVARAGFGSDLFWRALATLIFISVLWILWLLWQITPRSTVNPIVFQIQLTRQTASGSIGSSAAEERTGDTLQSSGSGQDAPPRSVLATGATLEKLKMETELKAPPKPAKSGPK